MKRADRRLLLLLLGNISLLMVLLLLSYLWGISAGNAADTVAGSVGYLVGDGVSGYFVPLVSPDI